MTKITFKVNQDGMEKDYYEADCVHSPEWFNNLLTLHSGDVINADVTSRINPMIKVSEPVIQKYIIEGKQTQHTKHEISEYTGGYNIHIIYTLKPL